MKELILKILRGVVIGLANAVPGVSGGTMMVSMGIYDQIIESLNHLFSRFKASVKTLFPYLIGMAVALGLGALILKKAFASIPLPTSALFIGLILGSIPAILYQMKGVKINALSVLLFVVFAAVVIIPKVIANAGSGADQALPLDFAHMVLYFLLGVMASASMVIPGISGSMMLMIFGYYRPIYTETLGGLFSLIKQGQWSQVGASMGVLLPFAAGIVVGLFAVAKLIEFLLRKWKGYTYCAILGMVVASPVVILMDQNNWQKAALDEADKPMLDASGAAIMEARPVTGLMIALAVAALAVGAFVAWKLAGDRGEKAEAKA